LTPSPPEQPSQPLAHPLHIVLLNQAFYPDVVATAQMSKDLADHLVRRGHRVTAVASRSIYGKSGAVLPNREQIAVPGATSTIEARRVGASIFGKAGIAARIADFILFYVLATWKVLFLKKPDVVICFTTPPFIALVGLLCSLLRGSKAIYWVMDLYPDLPVACGVMKEQALATRMFESLNRFLLRRSDVAVVLGRCMAERVLAKGSPAAKVVHIPVWSDLAPPTSASLSSSGLRHEWNLGESTVVMYSGNLGLGHDAQTMCEALRLLKAEPNLKFIFIGGGKRRQEIEAFIAANDIRNAQYRDYVAREQLNESLALADIHLISLKEGIEGIMVPSKLFGIMAVGKPSIFIGHPGSEISRVLTETDSGITVREGDGAGLAKAIRALAHDGARRTRMGQNASQSLRGRYDVETACRAWTKLIESVATNGANPLQSSNSIENNSVRTVQHSS
jgi:glycosyltransferase involved in cell wall biosynthesis